MCRHLAYVGPRVALHQLLFGEPDALATMARRPRHQHPPEDNRDGFGVGWYVPGATGPSRYVSLDPIWADDEFATESQAIESTGVVAAARAASPGAAIELTGNAPFESGQWLFSLNGRVDGFYDGLGDELRAGLGDHWHDEFDGDADTEVLFAMVLDRLDDGASPLDAVTGVVAALKARTTGRFNMLLSDGTQLVATRSANSLFACADDDAVCIASEPLSGDGWREVPDNSIVHARPGTLTITRLEDPT